MSIDSEVTSMTQNIQADYEGLENIGADLTGINKNILNIRTILDNIYNDLPKVTGEGTEVTLTPTRKGRLALIPKGNSTQESTTGKQLFNMLANIIIQQNCTAVNNNGIITITPNGTSNPQVALELSLSAGDYKLNSNTALCNATVFRNSNTTVANIGSSYSNVSLSLSESVNRISFNFTNPGSTTPFTLDLRTLMINSGSTAENWEQYTGGIPAPNPSYPFPIRNVTGENNVVVNNLNLMDTSNYIVSQGNLTVTRQNDGTFKLNGTYSGNTFIDFQNNIKLNGDYTIFLIKTNTANAYLNIYSDNAYTTANRIALVGSVGYKNFTYTGQCLSQRINIEPGTYNNDIIKIMLVKGTYSSLIDYIEYQNQTLPLNLGTIELNKIGTYQDYIYKNNDKWYKHEEIKEITLGDISSINSATIFDTPNTRYVSYSLSAYITESVSRNYNFFCNKAHSANGVVSDYGAYIISKTFLVMVNENDTVTTVNQKLNGAKLKFIPTTSTDIEITDTNLINQLENIDKMKSYNGTTIITSTFDSNNAQMIISASALKGE